jgi:hypothetical protein
MMRKISPVNPVAAGMLVFLESEQELKMKKESIRELKIYFMK